MYTSGAEPFRSLLLRHRGRTGLTQRQLAARVGAHRRTIQDWETGVSYPSAQLLRALLRVLLGAGGLSVGRETADAEALWSAVLRETRRMQSPFDMAWWAGQVAGRIDVPPRRVVPGHLGVDPEEPAATTPVERRLDWGDAPDVLSFVGRAHELATLRAWVLKEQCRLTALLGMGGIGKTTLAARLAQDLAPTRQ